VRAIDIGKRGEQAVCRYLKKNGYKIIEKNYRKKYGEIDIVAKENDVLCFVEVKTRKHTDFGLPCEYVTKSKQQKIVRTAYTYIQEKQYDCAIRFDVAEVLHDGQKIQALRYLPHAFTIS